MFGGLVGGDNSAAKPMATLPPSVPCAQGTALEGQQGLGSWSSLGPDGQGVARGRAVVQWPPPEPASGSPEPLSDADTEPDWGMPLTHDASCDPTPSTGRVGDGQRQGPRPGSGWELSEADGLGGEAGASQEWTLDCGGGLDLDLNTLASADNTPLNDQDGAPPSDHPARAVDAGTGTTTGADGPSPKKRAVEMVAGPPNEPAEDPPKGPLALATPLSRQRTLPTSRDGRPRPSGPWIAGMMYWIARNPALQAQTGVSVVPARINSNSQVNTPPFLTRRNRWTFPHPGFLVHAGDASGISRAAARAVLPRGGGGEPAARGDAPCGPGAQAARLVRAPNHPARLGFCSRVLQKIGKMSVSCAAERLFSAAFLQLLSCRRDAIRKHLSGQKERLWQNPTKGGNRTGDFSQLYLECKPFDFQALASALEHTRPGLMEDAVRAWRSKQGAA